MRFFTIVGLISIMLNILSYGLSESADSFGSQFRANSSSGMTRGKQTSDVVITPDGSRVYATAMGTHNMFVINTQTDQVTTVIDLCGRGLNGNWPFRLAITPDGTKIYVANAMSNNISIINTNTNRLVTTIDIGHPVRDIAFTPDGSFAYVDLGWDRIKVIDVRTNQVVQTISLMEGDLSYTLTVSHNGHRVYVISQSGGGRVYVIDVATNTVMDIFELGKEVTNQGLITVSPDDSKLYLPCGITGTSYARPTEGVNKVFVLDIAQRSVTSEIPIIGGPIGIRLSPDGSLAYVSTFAARKVFVVDLLNNQVAGEIEWNGFLEEWRRSDLRDMAVTPDGKKLYIAGWDADGVIVADTVTHLVTKVIEFNKPTTRFYEIAITPDGSRVYVSSEAATSEARSSLLVIDTTTNSIVDEIVREGGYPSNPYIAPDGQLLYAVSGNKVLIIEVATNNIIREISLGDPGGFFYDIAPVPNQHKAYVTNVRSQNVYVVDLNSGTVTKTIDVGWWPQMVVVTPDGLRAYVSRQNNPYDAGDLVIIDTTNDQVIGRIAVPAGMAASGRFDLLAVSPNGNYVYWGTQPQWLNVIEVASNNVVNSIDLGMQVIDREWGSPRGIHHSDMVFTTDGSRAYIPCGDAYYLIVLDVATGTIIDRIIDVGIEPVAIVTTPDNRFAYITNKESESVSVVDLSTNRVITSISKEQPVLIFSDVSSTHWAYNYIIAIYDDGITRGCAQDDPNTPENERRYCPEDNVTRGQMAAFIIRAKYGESFNYTTTPYFTDVPSTHTFFKYVQKLRDDGITVASGTYGVDNEVTRGQMAAFIIRAKYGETFSYAQTPYFSDVPSTHGFFKYVQKMKDEGITTVTGTYGVDDIVTRAQMAAFLARAFLGME